MLPMYVSRNGPSSSSSTSSSDSEPTSPHSSSPLYPLCTLSTRPAHASGPIFSASASSSMSAMPNQHQQSHRRRFQLAPVSGMTNHLSNSDHSLLPSSASTSTSASSTYISASGLPVQSHVTSTVSVKKRSLREVVMDRTAPLFPSILILFFGLLLILHLSTPSSLEFLTGPSSAYASLYQQSLFSSSSSSLSPSYFLPSLSSRSALSPKLSHSDLIAELERWRDEEYASKRLKVYFYDLPSSVNRGLVSRSHSDPPKIRDPYCDENFYSAEHTIAEFFRTSAVRTTNASDADFFYVPIYTTCYLLTHQPNDVNRTGKFFERAMQSVVQDYPYWNASEGRDHVLMFAQGFGARLSGEWKQYEKATFLVHNGDFEEEHFDTMKDVVVPPDLRHYLSPVGLTNPEKLLTKRNFVLFGGQVVNSSVSDHRGSNYSGGVRQFVQANLSEADGYKVTGVRSTTYIDDMRDSVFCLAPHGWHKWSPRPAYAILLGCVPVVISEQQALFLENLLDYDKISVWVRPGDIGQMDEKLRSMSSKQLTEKERNMREIWRMFWYGEEGLAKEAIMYSLYKKLHGVALHPNRVYI